MPELFSKRTLNFHQGFLGFQDGEEVRVVKSVESIDQKVGLDYLFCDVLLVMRKTSFEKRIKRYSHR